MALFSTPFDRSYRFTTSWLLSPKTLFFVRAFFGLYSFTTMVFMLVWRGTRTGYGSPEQTFSYFTYLTYWGICFYYTFAAVHTGSYWLRGRPFLDQWPRALQEMHSVLYTTIVTYPFLVTIVFWALLYDEPFTDAYDWWYNISVHLCNSVFALFEVVFTRTDPLPWWHLAPLVVFLGGYLGIAFITYSTQGFWVYGFLDDKNGTQRGKVAGYCVGILVAAVIIHVLVHFLIWFRKWVVETKAGLLGKHSPKDTQYSRANDIEMGDDFDKR